MEKKAFISYSHKDYDEVKLYAKVLESLSIPFFIDESGINGGFYTKPLINELNSCGLFILFLSKNSITSKHVLTETSIAFHRADKNNDVIILPIYLEYLGNEIYEQEIIYYIHAVNAIMDLTADRLTTFENKIRSLYGFPLLENNIKPRKNTYYSYEYEKEKERLSFQQQMILAVDLPIYKRITHGKKNLTLLDVGSGSGDSINSRVLGVNENEGIITKVVGLEYDEKTVNEANEKYPQYSFYHVDVEVENLSTVLETILAREGIEKFDIINISLLLLHLENPYKLLATLRPFLAKDGVIFIRDVDDGFTYGYPDKDGMIERLITMIGKTETAGFRRSGRRIHPYLKKLGFSFIERANLGMSSINMSEEEREAFFYMCLSWAEDDITIMTERYPDNKEWQNNLRWFNNNIEKIHNEFLNPSFIYNLGTIIYIASDKKID